MNTAQRLSFLNDIPLGKIGHASAAIIISGSALLVIIAFLWSASSSIWSGANALSIRADNIGNLENELLTRRHELAEYLKLSGISASQIETGTDGNKTKELLTEEENSFITAMEQHGFLLGGQLDASETTISPALSLYQSQLTFTGDLNAVSNFLTHESNASGYASDLTIHRNGNATNSPSHTLSIKLRRLGPKSENLESEPNE